MKTDVLIIGGGNAGLCAAISTLSYTKNIIIVEKATKKNRGGNSSLTINFRFNHGNPKDLLNLINKEDQFEDMTDVFLNKYKPYLEEDFLNDIIKTSNSKCNIDLAKMLVTNSLDTINWLRNFGHCWEYKPNILPGSLPVRLKGGGKELQNLNFKILENNNVNILYNCRLKELLYDEKSITGAMFSLDGKEIIIKAKSVILACGGFESSPQLRKKFLGNNWENICSRGVPYNTGDGIIAGQKIDAALDGDFENCHSSPQDSFLPFYLLPGENERSQRNSRYAFNYGITVNKNGKRFIDEGEDLPNFVYAKLGKEILKQPEKIAFQVFDSKVMNSKKLSKNYFHSRNFVISNKIDEIERMLDIDKGGLVKTIQEFNSKACNLEHIGAQKDGISTNNLEINKSNWAFTIDKPPFYVFPIKAGITFTYGGLKINSNCNVINNKGNIINGLFACGEIAAGVFYNNYPGGAGLMWGSVTGRIAGKSAALFSKLNA